MKARRLILFSLALVAALLLPSVRAWACACCSNVGDYYISFSRPSEYELGLMKEMRFGGTANLFMTEAGIEENARGLSHKAESYTVTGSLVGNTWRLVFRDGDKTGTLSLPLPSKMLNYVADIRDGQIGPGGGPLLYKEWRFEGQATGTGIFRAGIAPATKYFLVLQGRGNGCTNSEDFKHWRLQVTGRKAEYAFYGDLAAPTTDERGMR